MKVKMGLSRLNITDILIRVILPEPKSGVESRDTSANPASPVHFHLSCPVGLES